jgi:hypothetical protein
MKRSAYDFRKVDERKRSSTARDTWKNATLLLLGYLTDQNTGQGLAETLGT